MYEIQKILEEKRVTSTQALTLTLARCCHCGAVREMMFQNVVRANKEGRKHCPSCVRVKFHRMTNTRFWGIWKGMTRRATDPTDRDYGRYGGAGRGVSQEWRKFWNFYRDMYPTYRDGLSLDRINNAEGYSKENCRWVTNMEQQANKTNNRVVTYLGETIHLAEFCRRVGASRCALTIRLNKGMTPEQAVADYQNSKYPKNRKSRRCTTS